MLKPEVDYRRLRPSNLRSPEFSHLLYLLFWPAFGLAFLLLELWTNRNFHPIVCALDDWIPFCEWFVIPYYIWFAYLVGMILYSLLWDVDAFRNYMRFTMLTYWFTCLVYIVYPNCQELRPMVFERDNWMVDIVRGLYNFDTNTNVCPSLHVIGAVAVSVAAWHSKRLSTPAWRIVFTVLTVEISLSTVFLKQHSILDVIAALIVCAAAYPFVFHPKLSRFWTRRKTPAKAGGTA